MKLNGRCHSVAALTFSIIHISFLVVTLLRVWSLDLQLVGVVHLAQTVLFGILVILWCRWNRFQLIVQNMLWWYGVLALVALHLTVAYRTLCPQYDRLRAIFVVVLAISSLIHTSFILGIDMVCCSAKLKAVFSMFALILLIFVSCIVCGFGTLQALDSFNFLGDIPPDCSHVKPGTLTSIWVFGAVLVALQLSTNTIQFLRVGKHSNRRNGKSGIITEKSLTTAGRRSRASSKGSTLSGIDRVPHIASGFAEDSTWDDTTHSLATDFDTSNIMKPFALEVGESPLHGRGIYAMKDFYKGEVVEVCPLIEIDAEHVLGLLADYVYDSNSEDKQILLFGYGSLYNSSPDPNIETRTDIDNSFYFIARRFIPAGEELLHDYGENWFADRKYPYLTYDELMAQREQEQRAMQQEQHAQQHPWNTYNH